MPFRLVSPAERIQSKESLIQSYSDPSPPPENPEI